MAEDWCTPAEAAEEKISLWLEEQLDEIHEYIEMCKDEGMPDDEAGKLGAKLISEAESSAKTRRDKRLAELRRAAKEQCSW